jgi:hypothetical protein
MVMELAIELLLSRVPVLRHMSTNFKSNVKAAFVKAADDVLEPRPIPQSPINPLLPLFDLQEGAQEGAEEGALGLVRTMDQRSVQFLVRLWHCP